MSDALRHELDALSKEDLVRRAESQGIEGARKLTRLELIDELVRLGGGARGFLGKARDLIRDAVEVGLSRVLAPRDVAVDPAPSAEASPAEASPGEASPGEVSWGEVGSPEMPEAAPTAEAVRPSTPIPTVTLARVYLSQGHALRAREIVDEILRAEPDHRAALELRDELSRREERARSVPPPPPPAVVDDDGVDECVALVVDETAVHVAWDVQPSTRARAERAFRGAPTQLVLRVLVFEPAVEGPKVTSHDVPVDGLSGDHFARGLPPFSVVRAAVGLLGGARFVPIAHTADVESDPKASAAAPSSGGAPEVVVWSEAGTFPVAPAEAEAFRRDVATVGQALGWDGGAGATPGPRGGAGGGFAGTSPIGGDRGSGPAGRPSSPAGGPGRISSWTSISLISLAEGRSGSRV